METVISELEIRRHDKVYVYRLVGSRPLNSGEATKKTSAAPTSQPAEVKKRRKHHKYVKYSRDFYDFVKAQGHHYNNRELLKVARNKFGIPTDAERLSAWRSAKKLPNPHGRRPGSRNAAL